MNDLHSKLIFASMAFMAFLSFFVSFVMFLRRVNAMKNKTVRVGEFKTYISENEMPELLIQSSRHFKNLFEIPVLFYVASTLVLVLNLQDNIISILCWLFCIFRLAHTYVHLNYNNVFHRFRAFAGSFFSLIAIWVYLSGKYFLS